MVAVVPQPPSRESEANATTTVFMAGVLPFARSMVARGESACCVVIQLCGKKWSARRCDDGRSKDRAVHGGSGRAVHRGEDGGAGGAPAHQGERRKQGR